MDQLVNVVCVLRSGGIYTPEWVRKLSAQLQRWAPPHRFWCFTDMPGEVQHYCEPVELRESPPGGWWAKAAVFGPWAQLHFRGQPVVYYDLDTLLVGPQDGLFAIASQPDQPVTLIDDLYTPDKLASGLGCWTGGHEQADEVHEALVEALQHRQRRRRMDLTLRQVIPNDQPRLQQLWPGRIFSLKRGPAERGIPAGASVVCAHGPRKWVKPWAQKLWDSL